MTTTGKSNIINWKKWKRKLLSICFDVSVIRYVLCIDTVLF